MSESANRLTRASEPSESHATQSESKADTACESLLDTVKSTFDPFKQTFSSDGGALHHVSEAVNALASLQSAPSQLLNTGIAQIPLLDKMRGMPAATIGVPHLGTPHAHSHPPSSGFPLPSIGATIGSGCLSVLIGGTPAARVLDIGIAPTCGGLTPYFDIQTGSSNTFIGGMRAARMGIDMTRHCNPMGHAGKSGGEAQGAAAKGEEAASEAAEMSSRARWMGRAGKAWKVGNMAVGPASGMAGAAADAKHGEELAAVMMAAQTAADAAMMLLGNLMGKDPGIEPSMGVLMGGNPTVLIGGLPMPDAQMMWHGVKHGLGKKVRPKLPKWAQELTCEFWGEPVSAVTGEVKNDFTDYETDEVVPFKWGRHYCSGWHKRDDVLGYGFRHAWQHELQLLRTRAIYTDPRGTEYTFNRRAGGTYGGCCQGYEIEQLDGERFIVRHEMAGDLEFERASATDRSARCVGHVRDGARSSLHWNAHGCLAKIEQADVRGHVRRIAQFHQDESGRIVEVALTEVEGQINRIARYEYDTDGCLVRYRNALDAVSASEYDAQRRVARLTDANGYSFFYRYDGESRCLESTGQDGMWHVRFQYQPGRTVVTEADGGRWTVLYNDVGTITRVVDPYGGATEYVIGESGRITEEIDSGGRVLRWLYDAHERNTGRMDRWEHVWPAKDEAPDLPDPLALKVPDTPLGLQWGEVKSEDLSGATLLPQKFASVVETIFTREVPVSTPREQRDAAGRTIVRIDEYGGTERLRHDAAGNLVQRRDQDGRNYFYSPVSWNLRESETDPLGNTVRYRYTAKREIAAIVDGNGNESVYTYDLKNRVTGVQRHGVLRETYAYDAGDRLIEKRDSAGNILLRFEVGVDGLRSKRILASGEVHSYEYDRRGHFTKASTDKFDVTMAYDALGRRTADERDGAGVKHVYAGRCLTSTTYFGCLTVRHEAVGNDEVLIHTPTGGVHRLQRTPEGRILLRLSNGTNMLCAFDGYGRCIGRLVWPEGDIGDVHCVQYQYSATGELRRVIDSASGTTEYQYDAAHRLTGETRDGWPVRRYEYDRGGNLLSTAACKWMRYAEGNRLVSSSAGVFRYDHRNHLAEVIDGNNRRTTYHYNSLDLLVKVTWSDRGEAWTAEYDGLCRRVAKAIADARTTYYWDGDRLAAEVRSDGRLRIYVYVNESAFLPFMFADYPCVGALPETGREHFVFCNQVGLPEWIENSDREVVWRATDIDPYGAIQVAAGNAVEYDLRWPGHWLDRETGLHCNRFRSYSPILGRYLQTDPKGQSGGVNIYAYPDNPLVLIDVLGLFPARKNNPNKKRDQNSGAHAHGNNRSNQSKDGEADRESPSEDIAAPPKPPKFTLDDVDWDHVLEGKFHDWGFTGGHHADSVQTKHRIRITRRSQSYGLNAPYKADFFRNGEEIWNGKDMFPDSWSVDDVKNRVLDALNRSIVEGAAPKNHRGDPANIRTFTATVSCDGVEFEISGIIDNNKGAKYKITQVKPTSDHERLT
ncbi:RHS repeat-associated core domain-containing protein [Burkholderia sp. F1]|uniref:RHS repeat-associated core domain-containing protein n=1 Tax=Burkholderia sp. F1 TaxID=3366817 RepID=UPI003D753383